MLNVFLRLFCIYQFLFFSTSPSVSCAMRRRLYTRPKLDNASIIRMHIGVVVFRTWLVEGEDENSVRYLLLQAAHNYYSWILPKGRVNQNIGVAKKRLAARILRLKLGIEFDDILFLDKFRVVKPFDFYGIKKYTIFYLAELVNEIHDFQLPWFYSAYKWFSYDDAMAALLFDDQQDILSKCNKHLRNLKIQNDEARNETVGMEDVFFDDEDVM